MEKSITIGSSTLLTLALKKNKRGYSNSLFKKSFKWKLKIIFILLMLNR